MYQTNKHAVSLYVQCFQLLYMYIASNCSTLGLSPDLQSMEQIRRIMRPTDVPDTGDNIRILSINSHKAPIHSHKHS